MGNCFERCCGKLDKRVTFKSPLLRESRKYLRTRYNVERDISIEFENLMDDETQQEEMTKVVTAQECDLVKANNFDALLQEQKKIDVEIDSELVRQEEELRQEEEAYYEAKREAARAAKASRQLALKTGSGTGSGTGPGPGTTAPNAWLGEEQDWDMTGEDDFEMFLESVKARSLAARTRVLASQVPIDAQSTSSSTQMSKGEQNEQTHTEASSIDLEWEHEADKPSTEPDTDTEPRHAAPDEGPVAHGGEPGGAGGAAGHAQGPPGGAGGHGGRGAAASQGAGAH